MQIVLHRRRISFYTKLNHYLTMRQLKVIPVLYDLYMFEHADTFRLTVGEDNANSFTCVDITKPTKEGTGITEKILTCPELFKSINKIKIFNTGEGPLKVFEFKIMGMKTLFRLHFH